MKKNKKLILIELNELNFEIVKKYSEKYNLNFFNSFFFEKLKNSYSEQKYENLEPWIQWVSVHSGKSADEHKIYRLGDIKEIPVNQIFEKIESLGFKVGAISPMNTLNKMKNPLYFLSDPWTDGGNTSNNFLNLLAKTISRTVNTNSTGKILIKDYVILIYAIIKYADKKNFFLYLKVILKSFSKKWFKAIFLDLILNDLHLNLLKKFNTDFSCMFLNAGAHIQHHYFFNSEFNNTDLSNPEWYVKKEYDPIKDVIFFYDKILSEYSKIKNYEILIATGLSQIPYDRKKFYYRLKNHESFLNSCQILYKKVLPRMTRDFVIEFNNEYDCLEASKQIYSINTNNKKNIFNIDNRGKSLFVTLQISNEIKSGDYIILNNKKKIMLIDHVAFVALKNGMHHEKGYLYCTNKNDTIVNKNLSHVKELHDVIYNFFNN